MQPKAPLRYHCPGCNEEIVWDEDNPWRPFCSQRCRDEDFLAWSREQRVIEGDPLDTDWMSEDQPPENKD